MLTPSLTGWRAQYDRMKRSYARATGPYASSVAYDDDLHHFMQDCWHLKDWIRHDPGAGVGKLIEALVDGYTSLRIVADLANASKHLTRTKHDRTGAHVTSTNVTVHLGQPRPVDVDYTVTLAHGSQRSAESLVDEAVRDWDALLTEQGLLP
jgi:hypothetical protein